MTHQQFHAECTARTIYPLVALENDSLRDALRARDDDEVIRILNEEF